MQLKLGGILISACLLVTTRLKAFDFIDTGSTGGDQPISNLQPSLGLNYLVSLQGTQPNTTTKGDSGRYLGETVLFAGNFAPQGWAFANGATLLISQNPQLFSLMGTTWGGNGVSNFALPDLRNNAAMDAGQGTGLTNRPLATLAGSVTQVLNYLPNHAHSVPAGYPLGITGFASQNDDPNVPTLQPSLAIKYFINEAGNFADPSQNVAQPLIGQVRMTATNLTPGSQDTNGQILPISGNTFLFAELGKAYGGNGTSNFGLPDLRGRLPIGTGNGNGLTARSVGNNVGAETTVFDESMLPPHHHTLAGNDITGNTGAGQPMPMMQPSLAMNYLIATEGVVPTALTNTGDGSQPFIGEIVPFAGNILPEGWLPCDGQVLPTASYPDLALILGSTYGGDGVLSFALPDLQGRTPIGAGGLYSLGQKFGSEADVLTVDQIPEHFHGFAVPEPTSLAALLAVVYVWPRRR
jgi:microcystin-dependent protein